MDFEFSVINPAQYARGGHVSLPGGALPELFRASTGLTLFQDCGSAIKACDVQLDCLDPFDPESHVLSFYMAQPMEADSTARMILRSMDSPTTARQWYFPSGSPDRVDLYNAKVFVSFTLVPQPGSQGASCYAGAAQSVRVSDRELLDSYKTDWTLHDPEKRCMQIDKVWCDGVEHSLYDKPYRLVSDCSGPVRTVKTVAQVLRSPGQEFCLYRVLSLFRDANYVIEELFIRDKMAPAEQPALDLPFSPRYYADIDAQQWHSLFLERSDEDPLHLVRHGMAWLAIHCPYGDPEAQRPGYGFASDGSLRSVVYPHNPLRDRTYSWILDQQQRFRCLHLFLRAVDTPHRTGVAWFEQIYVPLKATALAGGSAVAASA
jgi:hypothetical protein